MIRIRRIALPIILAWGWKRAAIALLAGAVSSLAMAPFNAWPVLFVTFPVVVWLIDGAAAGRLRGIPAAALTGWWFGLGYFVPGLYWIGYAFLVQTSSRGCCRSRFSACRRISRYSPRLHLGWRARSGRATRRACWRWRRA